MLLMPLIENLFKHGIDKRRKAEKVRIFLILQADQLNFTVSNPLQRPIDQAKRTGVGLHNLQSRLELLYGNRYTLTTEAEQEKYVARLTIPIL